MNAKKAKRVILAEIGAVWLIRTQGDISEMCRLLRSGLALSADFREDIALVLEGKIKRPAHRPKGSPAAVQKSQHEFRRDYYKAMLDDVVKELKRSGKPCSLEHAKGDLAAKLGWSDRQLKRALDPWEPPRTRSRPDK